MAADDGKGSCHNRCRYTPLADARYALAGDPVSTQEIPPIGGITILSGDP
jgi:hypothetical protein